ncbi:glycosyltransferase [Roseomonas sp. CCTCC AB2023176]|uniref:glycosyltransferase n=1 Tax=Roseomonas sp. CCTCC AB2023176 TaxID=3342640 RepID=UPI0035E11C71
MTALNLLLLPHAKGVAATDTLVSILIPARDEAENIGTCLDAALASTGVAIEVVVMDDGSRDGTAEIVAARAAADPRLRLERAPALPLGWTGKVHACQRLADAARGTHLLFIDADVRLQRDAAARMAGHAARTGIALVSGVPRQDIETIGEALTVPAINLMMMGYLPGAGRAFTRHKALAAACGQLILVERGAYDAVGGHATFRDKLHDGLCLARNLRAAGHQTEIVDGAELATCRMYKSFGEAWRGFLKNAREGMATPIGLPIWTVLLFGGHVLPWLLLPSAQAALALTLTYIMRAAITVRAREPAWTIPLHPAIVLMALAIQWTAMIRGLLGRPAGWKGRAYGAAPGA